jgi:bifunctional N-acetylglucosamine-1-phosphate-uridyltransferase/glucosamine-1-phosphate-acetyltransferase GlmU-like protein
LAELRPENAQGEYYLTDVPKMLASAGDKVGIVISDDPDSLLGINTPAHLAEAENIYTKRQA